MQVILGNRQLLDYLYRTSRWQDEWTPFQPVQGTRKLLPRSSLAIQLNVLYVRPLQSFLPHAWRCCSIPSSYPDNDYGSLKGPMTYSSFIRNFAAWGALSDPVPGGVVQACFVHLSSRSLS